MKIPIKFSSDPNYLTPIIIKPPPRREAINKARSARNFIKTHCSTLSSIPKKGDRSRLKYQKDIQPVTLNQPLAKLVHGVIFT